MTDPILPRHVGEPPPPYRVTLTDVPGPDGTRQDLTVEIAPPYFPDPPQRKELPPMPARTALSYTSRVSSLRLTDIAHNLLAQMAAADGVNRQHFLEGLLRAEAKRRRLLIPPATGEPVAPPMLPRLDGATVRALRLAAGWSQGALARASGATTNTISRIEKGGSGTREVTAQGIARALGVPLSALQGPAPVTEGDQS